MGCRSRSSSRIAIGSRPSSVDDVAAAARHIRLDEAAIVLVGDVDAFGAELEAAGLGQLVIERDDVAARSPPPMSRLRRPARSTRKRRRVRRPGPKSHRPTAPRRPAVRRALLRGSRLPKLSRWARGREAGGRAGATCERRATPTCRRRRDARLRARAPARAEAQRPPASGRPRGSPASGPRGACLRGQRTSRGRADARG